MKDLTDKFIVRVDDIEGDQPRHDGLNDDDPPHDVQ
jgi:hypothetical protein